MQFSKFNSSRSGLINETIKFVKKSGFTFYREFS